MKYKTILFDYDGTLVDTYTFVINYTKNFVRQNNLTQLANQNPEQLFWDLNNGQSTLTSEQKQLYWTGYRAQEPVEVQLYPGVAEVLKDFKSRGIKLGIVTNRRKDIVEDTLGRKGMGEIFEVIIGNQEVTSRKPDPEPIFKAMEALGAKREGTLYVGNSREDVEAGLAAGVATVFFKESPDYYELIKDWLEINKPLAVIEEPRKLLDFSSERGHPTIG